MKYFYFMLLPIFILSGCNYARDNQLSRSGKFINDYGSYYDSGAKIVGGNSNIGTIGSSIQLFGTLVGFIAANIPKSTQEHSKSINKKSIEIKKQKSDKIETIIPEKKPKEKKIKKVKSQENYDEIISRLKAEGDYDKFGFDNNNIHKDTGTIYNNCGFKRNGTYLNGTKEDEFGKTFIDCYAIKK